MYKLFAVPLLLATAVLARGQEKAVVFDIADYPAKSGTVSKEEEARMRAVQKKYRGRLVHITGRTDQITPGEDRKRGVYTWGMTITQDVIQEAKGQLPRKVIGKANFGVFFDLEDESLEKYKVAAAKYRQYLIPRGGQPPQKELELTLEGRCYEVPYEPAEGGRQGQFRLEKAKLVQIRAVP